jgi:hypothetical protein
MVSCRTGRLRGGRPLRGGFTLFWLGRGGGLALLGFAPMHRFQMERSSSCSVC